MKDILLNKLQHLRENILLDVDTMNEATLFITFDR